MRGGRGSRVKPRYKAFTKAFQENLAYEISPTVPLLPDVAEITRSVLLVYVKHDGSDLTEWEGHA